MEDITSVPDDAKLYDQGYIAPHPSIGKDAVDVVRFIQSRQVYTPQYLRSVTPAHANPSTRQELLGWWWHVLVRTAVGWGVMLLVGDPACSERAIAARIATLAAAGQALGAAGAAAVHLRSSLLARPDGGRAHTLLAEAECCGVHKGVLVAATRPSFLARWLLLVIQAPQHLAEAKYSWRALRDCSVLPLARCVHAGVILLQLAAQLVAPRVAHAYAAYRAEEQIFNYSLGIRLAERAVFRGWAALPAPDLARSYYALPAGAPMRDALLCMRADEACIGHINSTLAKVPSWERNPFVA